ncbi:MAG TPA: hypothetical protein VII99_00170 [Bacteroidia bacterium]
MKKNILFCSLLFAVCSFAACSSGQGEKKKETKDSVATVDTSLHGRIGVIEKNPPVNQGDYVLKYPSGVVKMRGFYINGKRNGQWTSFFEDGKIQSDGFFKDGLRDGKANVYYQSGQLYYEGYYRDGKEAGTWVFYDEKGNVAQKKIYE